MIWYLFQHNYRLPKRSETFNTIKDQQLVAFNEMPVIEFNSPDLIGLDKM